MPHIYDMGPTALVPPFTYIAFYFRGVSNVIQGANKNVDPCSDRVTFGSCSPRSYKVEGKGNLFPKPDSQLESSF